MKILIILFCAVLVSCTHNKKNTPSGIITNGEMDKRFGVLLNLDYNIDSFSVEKEFIVNSSTSIINLNINKIPVQDIKFKNRWFEENSFKLMLDFYDNYEKVIPNSDNLCLNADNSNICFATSAIRHYHSHDLEINAFLEKLKTKKFNGNEVENSLYSSIPLSERSKLIEYLKTNKIFYEGQKFNIVYCSNEKLNESKTLFYQANVVNEDTLFGNLSFTFLNDTDSLKLLGFNFKRNADY